MSEHPQQNASLSQQCASSSPAALQGLLGRSEHPGLALQGVVCPLEAAGQRHPLPQALPCAPEGVRAGAQGPLLGQAGLGGFQDSRGLHLLIDDPDSVVDVTLKGCHSIPTLLRPSTSPGRIRANRWNTNDTLIPPSCQCDALWSSSMCRTISKMMSSDNVELDKSQHSQVFPTPGPK